MKQIPGRDKVLSMLGLAARSRNVVSGGFATEAAVKGGTVPMPSMGRKQRLDIPWARRRDRFLR